MHDDHRTASFQGQGRDIVPRVHARGWQGCFVGVALALAAGCSSSDHGSTVDSPNGTAVLALTQIPDDVSCIKVVATGTQTISKSFDVLPGSQMDLTLSGLPVGSVQFSAAAYGSACALVGTSAPTWIGDPVAVTIVAGQPVSVALTLHRSGNASVSISFEDDAGGGTSTTEDAGGSTTTTPTTTLATFQHDQDVAWCTRMSECCEGTIDVALCTSYFDVNYGALNLGGYLQVYGGDFSNAHFTFNTTQASLCLSLLSGTSCTNHTASEMRTTFATCMTALQGTLLPNTTGCLTSAECLGGYCEIADGASTGTCRALKSSGDSCDDPNWNGDRCNTLGAITSTNYMHCEPLGGYDSDGNLVTGTCQNGFDLGHTCYVNQECASGLCNGTCISTEVFPDPWICSLSDIQSSSDP